jgi:hypothetical protein
MYVERLNFNEFLVFPNLKNLLQIARTCAIFCVEEIIIFDDTATMTQKFVFNFLTQNKSSILRDLDEYNSGNWSGDWTSENKIESQILFIYQIRGRL